MTTAHRIQQFQVFMLKKSGRRNNYPDNKILLNYDNLLNTPLSGKTRH